MAALSGKLGSTRVQSVLKQGGMSPKTPQVEVAFLRSYCPWQYRRKVEYLYWKCLFDTLGVPEDVAQSIIQ